MKQAPVSHRLVVLPLVGAVVALFGGILLGGQALFWGTPALQFIPWWSWAWETLLSGHLPLWNPLVGMGAPLVANYQSALFYPPYWNLFLLYGIGGAPLMAWGQTLLVMLHLLAAGIGMARLAQRLGLGTLAQTVAGLSFGLSGYLVSRAGFFSINAALAWLPWILWAVTPDAGKFAWLGRRRLLALSAFLALQLLAGHAQIAWYTILLTGLWSGYWAFAIGLERGNAGKAGAGQRILAVGAALYQTWGRLALAGALAAGLAAVQLAPTAEYLSQSQRAAAVDYEMGLTYSFWPWRLIGLLAPNFFGNPAQGDYWGYANYWEDAIYIGLLPALLFLGTLRGKTRLAGLRWFLWGVFGLALLFALGKNTPIFPWLYQHVPTFAMFNAPTRWMIWGVFALAFLAAMGAENWRRPEGRGLYWTRLGTAGSLAVSLGSGLAMILMGDIKLSFVSAAAQAGVLGIAVGLLSLSAPLREGSETVQDQTTPVNQLLARMWPWLVAFLIAFDLTLAGWGLNPGFNLSLYQPGLGSEVKERLGDQRLYWPEQMEYEIKYDRFFQFETFHPGEDWHLMREVVLSNSNLLEGMVVVNNYDPMQPGRYVAWMELVNGLDRRERERFLHWMDVGLAGEIDLSQASGARFDPLGGGMRARWVGCAIQAENADQALEMISQAQVDIRTQVVIEGAPGLANALCPERQAEPVAAQVIEDGPNTLRVRVSAPGAGWLVLSDVWYPGWQAWVDGNRVEITPANLAFRAAPLTAGEHEVIFEYRPWSFYAGALVSLASGLVFAWLWRRRN